MSLENVTEQNATETAVNEHAEQWRAESRNGNSPSSLSQMFTVFKLQMRLFSKSKSTYLLIFLALLIPILAYSGAAKTIFESDLFLFTPSMSYLLILLPLMIVLIPAMVSSRTLSSEFRNRTVYLNFPLPVSRTTFYAGKFLASLTLSIGFIALAFGLAFIASDSLFEPAFPYDVGGALAMCVIGTFAVTATAFGLGPLSKRGSFGTTMALMIGLPFIMLIVVQIFIPAIVPDISSNQLNSIWDAVKVLPAFMSYNALFALDNGFMGTAGSIIKTLFEGGGAIWSYSLVSLVWGILFLLLGLSNVRRREL